ncbi:MAG TPA: hypothetical protein VGV93_06005 [Acidimicrobiales bacterium]|nr:hypothetical protein [Acidimicrobiales bacterium]
MSTTPPTDAPPARDDDKLAHRDFLLSGAAWQDSLLQNYRMIFLTLHTILFAIGNGLFASALGQDSVHRAATLYVLLLAVSGASLYLLKRMRGIILARGNDINFWHRQIIALENDLAPSIRDFTRFKIHQKSHRDQDYDEIFMNGTKISDLHIDMLIQKGLGHTRRIIDKQLFHGLAAGWILLAAASSVRMLQLGGIEVSWN